MAYEHYTDEQLAKAWIDTDTKTVKTGKRRGQLRNDAMKASDKMIVAARKRGFSLPCEGENLADCLTRNVERRNG